MSVVGSVSQDAEAGLQSTAIAVSRVIPSDGAGKFECSPSPLSASSHGASEAGIRMQERSGGEGEATTRTSVRAVA